MIGFVYKNKCHSVTQTYADAIKAIPIKITGPINAIWKGLTTKTYDSYFIESVMSLLVPITKRILGEKVKIIFRGNDGLFGEKTEAYLYTKNKIKKKILLWFIKQMDAIIVESEMTKKHARQWTSIPIEVCESYVESKKKLEKIKPNLNTKSFLFIGEYRPPYDHKNIEDLISLFNNMPKYTLTVIGKNTSQLKNIAKENITILDYVQDIYQYYTRATYYIHLPKYETGPITIFEAATAGLIIITNNNAGHRTIIEAVNKQLIINEDNAQSIQDHIHKIVKMSLKEKQKISEKFKKQGRTHYNKEEMKDKFKKVWEVCQN
ncbi:MAG: glycosyltransferase [Candidatus Woesearchaeota archaeon]|jgi:glycosyltransferase involved in cell wall biosynthesis